MKAIILISSIFYILGLKIGNKIDLVKKVKPEVTISATTKEKEELKCCDYNKLVKKKIECDTISSGTSYSDALLKNIEF